MLLGQPAVAALAPDQLADVGVRPPPDASLPLDARLTEPRRAADDARRRDRRPAGRGDLRRLRLSAALLADPCACRRTRSQKADLQPGVDYRLVVIGFNPRRPPTDGKRMVGGQIGFGHRGRSRDDRAEASEPVVGEAHAAVGYHYAYDAERGRYAHPVALFVVTANGRLSRVLSGLAISGGDVRLALVEAGKGAIGAIARSNAAPLLRLQRLDRLLHRSSSDPARSRRDRDDSRHCRRPHRAHRERRREAHVNAIASCRDRPRPSRRRPTRSTFALIGVSFVIVILVAGLIVIFAYRYRRGSTAPRGAVAGRVCSTKSRSAGPSRRSSASSCSSGGRARIRFLCCFRRVQAMEIHVVAKQWMWKSPAPERPARDRHAARSRRRAGPAGDDFAGRHPLLRRARLSHQAGHPPRALCRVVVSGDQDRHVPSLIAPSSAARRTRR